MIRFTKPKSVESGLNVAPLIDIVLLLLIFFLLTSVFMTPGLELALPEARTAAASGEGPIVVQITKEATVYLDGREVGWGELKDRLEAALEGRRKEPLVVKADRDAPFGAFVRVMDISRELGALRLTISTTLPREMSAVTQAEGEGK